MPPVSDLVRDSKLETEFCQGYIQHVYHVSGVTPRQRKLRMEERWKRGRNLGTGSFGTVWLEKLIVEGDEVKYRAVKEIRKGVRQSDAIDYSRELEAIAKFSHQKYEMCFVKSFGWFDNHESVFIAMEYFPLGDLQNYLSLPLPENDVKQITSQVLEGLSFMHENGFAHRDLKPTNILVKSEGPDWWLKIGDFGISKRVQENMTALRSFKGTFGFLAPEILVQQKLIDLSDDDFEVSDEYTVAVDMWSLGEIAFRALTTEQPFPVRSLRAYIKGISPFPAERLQERGVTMECCKFLNSLLTPKPKDRLTARDALSHIWIDSQILPLAMASTVVQRLSPATEESIPHQGYVTIAASASWSTVNGTIYKPNALPNPASTEISLEALQPMQNTIDTAHQGTHSQRAHEMVDSKLANDAGKYARAKLEEQPSMLRNKDSRLEINLAASASGDRIVRLWDSATGVAYRTLEGHSETVWGVAFSPDGRLIASGSVDKTVKLWDTATGAVHRTLEGHLGAVIGVAFSPDGSLIASASFDKTVKLWDTATDIA